MEAQFKKIFNEINLENCNDEIKALKCKSSKNECFNKETVNTLINIIKMSFINLKGCAAFNYALPYIIHMERIFLKFYGEECNMPENC